ncbi:MAG TPA: hypothetical protein DEH25_16395, partial [Chloroflexi bacterium]|nr:hypothetical protein [Chloroflexota bacterium]
TGFVIGDEAPSLYEYSASRIATRPDIVPALALDLPPAGEQRQDFWVIPVKMIESVTWSDGEPLTAHDVVFTIETVFALQLGETWSDFYPAQSLAAVKAVDDYTVEFSFYSQPGLSEWQYAVALGPILPQHFWQPYVDEALANLADVPPPQTCDGILTETQQAACQAYAKARRSLYAVEPVSPPSGGGYVTAGFTSDRTIRRKLNPYFYAAGFKISEYANGAWERVFPDGTLQQFYGEPQGEPLLSYHRGPFNRSIEFSIYESDVVAYDILAKGRVDYVLNPDSLTDEWLRQTAQASEIEAYTSAQNNLAYLAFNLRRAPFDRLEFRQALEILIDRERITQKDLAGLAYPADAIVPQQNAFWWSPSLGSGEETLSPQVRFETALQILKVAGWSWKTEPTWDPITQQIIPGVELRQPGGGPMPETNLIFPSAASDVLMAVFGQEIADILTNLGIPVVAESLEREILVNRALIAGGSFDLYILDWRLPLYPGYLCQLFTSTNDTLLTGGYNTTGYNNPSFDALCDPFLLEPEAQTAQKLAQQMQNLLAADLPYIPLFNPQVVDMMHTNVILPYSPIFGGLASSQGFQNDTRVLNK